MQIPPETRVRLILSLALSDLEDVPLVSGARPSF